MSLGFSKLKIDVSAPADITPHAFPIFLLTTAEDESEIHRIGLSTSYCPIQSQ
jgi:hypothetical protein